MFAHCFCSVVVFFLNDVCQIANLPKLFVMAKGLNKSVNAPIDVKIHLQTNTLHTNT